jgi:hypothetical protein
MAWDGIIRIKLSRPLTDDEKSRQLKVDIAAAVTPNDNFSVFEKNEVFLEASNAQYHERGMLTYGGIFAVPLCLFGIATITHMMLNVPDAIRKNGEMAAGLIGLGVIGLCVVLLLGAVLWGLHTEWFTWTRLPVRFNRRTRMVHAFRGAGAKGVISVPWDKAFFFVEPRGKEVVSRTNSYNIRCHVLDERQYVVQSFSVGKSVASFRDDSTTQGAEIADILSAEFEYIRRYMENGPYDVPSPEYIPTEVSLSNSMKIWMRSDKRLLRSGNPLAMLVLAFSPFAALTGLLHYIGQLSCREPVWPEDIERECAFAGPETVKV